MGNCRGRVFLMQLLFLVVSSGFDGIRARGKAVHLKPRSCWPLRVLWRIVATETHGAASHASDPHASRAVPVSQAAQNREASPQCRQSAEAIHQQECSAPTQTAIPRSLQSRCESCDTWRIRSAARVASAEGPPFLSARLGRRT
ncbi:hypothetical protein FB451DRAFT_1228204 [Mycena latifolia]|nr:hypothetical protein FB451DRAFT_1228204 [Mycena latifolia]